MISDLENEKIQNALLKTIFTRVIAQIGVFSTSFGVFSGTFCGFLNLIFCVIDMGIAHSGVGGRVYSV